MILKYPGVIGKPIILVEVECLLTGRKFLVPMLLDTGADGTCFPAKFAEFFGHDNDHPDVVRESCSGVGGDSVTYLHSVRISLLHPAKSPSAPGHTAWTARATTASFIEKLDCGFGLIGMDMINTWKHVTFQPDRRGGVTILIGL